MLATADRGQTFCIEKLDATTPVELFQELADLHVDSIHGGIMEALGPKFIASLYQQLCTRGEVLMYIARRDSKTVGFVAGSVNLIRCVKNIGFVGLAQLALSAGVHAWRPSLLKKVLATVGYFFRNKGNSVYDAEIVETGDPARSELLAIAVAKEARGQGVGSSLVSALEHGLQSNSRGSYFVSTNQNEVASNAFYRATGFTLVGQKRHHDLMLNIYRKGLEQ